MCARAVHKSTSANSEWARHQWLFQRHAYVSATIASHDGEYQLLARAEKVQTPSVECDVSYNGKCFGAFNLTIDTTPPETSFSQTPLTIHQDLTFRSQTRLNFTAAVKDVHDNTLEYAVISGGKGRDNSSAMWEGLT